MPGLGFGLRQSTFPLVRARQSAQSAGKAVSPRRPIKRQSGLFWAAKCCFWPRTSHFLGGVLAQFWPWFRAIYRRFLAMVWSQIGNFWPASRLLSGVPPEPPRQTCYPIGARAKKRRKTAGSSRAGHPARNISRPRNILPWLKPAKWFPWPRPRQSGLSGHRSKREIFGTVVVQKPKS